VTNGGVSAALLRSTHGQKAIREHVAELVTFSHGKDVQNLPARSTSFIASLVKGVGIRAR